MCLQITLPIYFLNDFEMVVFAPIMTGITAVFALHMSCTCVVSSLYSERFRLLCVYIYIP
jgi:hypothetical protein